MSTVKVSKRTMFALELTRAALKDAFGSEVMVTHASVTSNVVGTAPNGEGPAVEAVIKGATRGNVPFRATCIIYHDDFLNEWYGHSIELLIQNDVWIAHLGQRCWLKRCSVDYHQGHQRIQLS